MKKGYLDKDQNMLKLKFQFDEMQSTVEIFGYHDIQMNTRPLPQYKQSHLWYQRTY